MVKENRNYSSLNYRYGFNGKEKDNDVVAAGPIYDYGFRIYYPALAKFLSVDPLGGHYPWNSFYAFAENDPIRSIDVDGTEKFEMNSEKNTLTATMTFGVIKNSNDPKVNKNYKPAIDRLDLVQVNKDISQAFITIQIKLTPDEAKEFGFDPSAKDNLYTIQFNVKVEATENGKKHLTEDKKANPENTGLVGAGKVKNPLGAGSDGKVPANEDGSQEITLNDEVFKTNASDAETTMEIKKQYNALKGIDSPIKDKTSPGQIISHEIGHFITEAEHGPGDPGGLLNIEGSEIKVNEKNVKDFLRKYKKDIKEQTKPAKK